MKTHKLLDKDASTKFYEARYADGYMDDWDAAKKERVKEVIIKMNLPTQGQALDYGCGNGVFTEVLAQALPGWKIYGSDISLVALANAARRFPKVLFFEGGKANELTFNFIFTHHVLEHVPDISASAQEMAALAAPNAHMLHIMPCGNAGSFEHKICALRKDGTDPTLGNRFFFEDEGHVRRLTSAQLVAVFAPFGFRYTQGLFANQYEGALAWISDYSDEFITDLTNPAQAVDTQASLELMRIRQLLFDYKHTKVQALAYRANGIPYTHGLRSLGIMIKQFLKAYRFNHQYEADKRRFATEWATRATQENGSEMYIMLNPGQ